MIFEEEVSIFSTFLEMDLKKMQDSIKMKTQFDDWDGKKVCNFVINC